MLNRNEKTASSGRDEGTSSFQKAIQFKNLKCLTDTAWKMGKTALKLLETLFNSMLNMKLPNLDRFEQAIRTIWWIVENVICSNDFFFGNLALKINILPENCPSPVGVKFDNTSLSGK